MTFLARLNSPCAGCDDPIDPGDIVEYFEDELVHEGCRPQPAPAPRPVCPICFMEIALNGACSCDL
jgi:hypothetical protein